MGLSVWTEFACSLPQIAVNVEQVPSQVQVLEPTLRLETIELTSICLRIQTFAFWFLDHAGLECGKEVLGECSRRAIEKYSRNI